MRSRGPVPDLHENLSFNTTRTPNGVQRKESP